MAWLALAFLVWVWSPATGGASEASGTAARLIIERPVFEGGRFEPGAVFRHEFMVRNEGRGPLEIREVRVGCSCVVVDYDRLIPPGGTGRITVAVSIHREWAGRDLRRTIWVSSNDPLAGQTSLILRGQVAAE